MSDDEDEEYAAMEESYAPEDGDDNDPLEVDSDASGDMAMSDVVEAEGRASDAEGEVVPVNQVEGFFDNIGKNSGAKPPDAAPATKKPASKPPAKPRASAAATAKAAKALTKAKPKPKPKPKAAKEDSESESSSESESESDSEEEDEKPKRKRGHKHNHKHKHKKKKEKKEKKKKKIAKTQPKPKKAPPKPKAKEPEPKPEPAKSKRGPEPTEDADESGEEDKPAQPPKKSRVRVRSGKKVVGGPETVRFTAFLRTIARHKAKNIANGDTALRSKLYSVGLNENDLEDIENEIRIAVGVLIRYVNRDELLDALPDPLEEVKTNYHWGKGADLSDVSAEISEHAPMFSAAFRVFYDTFAEVLGLHAQTSSSKAFSPNLF